MVLIFRSEYLIKKSVLLIAKNDMVLNIHYQLIENKKINLIRKIQFIE